MAHFCCPITPFPSGQNGDCRARARGVNVVLTTGRPYAGVHSYLKELHMEQPGDYCITYNGALVQKAGDGSTVAQTALSYDDYRYLEQLSGKLAHISTPSIATRCIPRTVISAIHGARIVCRDHPAGVL